MSKKNDVKVIDEYGLNANYTVINATALKNDCQNALKKLYPGKILSKVLLMHDVNGSTFSNCYRNYLAHKEVIDKLYKTYGIDRIGYMRIRDYNAIIAAFELKKDYILDKHLDDNIVNDFPDLWAGEKKSCDNNETSKPTFLLDTIVGLDKISKNLESIATTLASIEKIMYDRTYDPIKDCITDPEEE